MAGQGIGAVLLNDLLKAGEAVGIRRFHAEILADNRRMVHLLTRHTTILTRIMEHGVLTVTFMAREAL